MLAQHKAAPEQGIGRRRQADETEVLTLVEIELGQSQSRKRRHEECHIRHIVLQRSQRLGIVHLVEEMEKNGTWRYTEGDYIGQRIEFLTDRRRDA